MIMLVTVLNDCLTSVHHTGSSACQQSAARPGSSASISAVQCTATSSGFLGQAASARGAQPPTTAAAAAAAAAQSVCSASLASPTSGSAHYWVRCAPDLLLMAADALTCPAEPVQPAAHRHRQHDAWLIFASGPHAAVGRPSQGAIDLCACTASRHGCSCAAAGSSWAGDRHASQLAEQSGRFRAPAITIWQSSAGAHRSHDTAVSGLSAAHEQPGRVEQGRQPAPVPGECRPWQLAFLCQHQVRQRGRVPGQHAPRDPGRHVIVSVCPRPLPCIALACTGSCCSPGCHQPAYDSIPWGI